MIKPWTKTRTKALGNFRIFSLRSDEKISPRTNEPHEFFIIDCVNWLNVVAITPDQKLVMIEQFRHGSNTVELEIPGGTMDVVDASPVATAIRELREETGYEGQNATVIGEIFPNPAIMSNTCYTVLVENCEKTSSRGSSRFHRRPTSSCSEKFATRSWSLGFIISTFGSADGARSLAQSPNCWRIQPGRFVVIPLTPTSRSLRALAAESTVHT